MPDDAPFLAAIRAAPEDDAPRLVYADWLEENGQPERAEFIRVQCELARRESPELRKREAELLAWHHDAFAGSLTTPGLRFRFRRGFAVSFGHTGHFHRPGALMLRFFPDGTWLYGAPIGFGDRPEDQTIALGDLGVSQGTYVLNALDDPLSIELFCAEYERLGISARAELAHGAIELSLSTPDGLFQRKPEPYRHVDVPSIDSFEES